MYRIAKGIVKCRVLILILSIVLLIPSALGFLSTRINYDIFSYLPGDIETMKGQDILQEEFGKGGYGIFVCDNMTDAEVTELEKKFEQVDHVTDVLSLADMNMPVEMLPQDVQDLFYAKDGSGQLLFMFFDTTTSADETIEAVGEVRKIAGEQCFLSSMSAIVTDTKNLIEKEMPMYVIIAAVLNLIVMMICLDSFLVPILFLADIGLAILYNLGSNVIQGQISFITMALVAVLQLGVTTDYSIFLYNSYKEMKLKYSDRKEAMAQAITATIVSVSASSLTTIAGFIALCFMTFTLGMDLGIVMAKGVLLGVICCVTVLPALLLTFDNAIGKTSHKAIHLPHHKFADFIAKHHKILAVLMLALWIPAIIGYNNISVYYKLDKGLPKYLNSVQANEILGEKYQDMNSVSMLLVSSDLSHKDTKEMLGEMKKIDGVSFAVGLDSVIGSSVPEEFVPSEVRDMLDSGKWKLLVVSSEYQIATDEINELCEELAATLKKYDPNGMVIGESACTKDLIKICDHDFQVVSAVSIFAIFALILLSLKSALLPVLLVLIIELAIYLNMGMAFYTGTELPFIASVTIGTIQLGACVDYAILMTTRYKQERMEGKSKEESTRIAIDTSMHSVITSALSLFAATIGVGLYSSVDLVGALCLLLSRGAIISMIVVLVFLPTMYMVFDKWICKTTGGLRKIAKS